MTKNKTSNSTTTDTVTTETAENNRKKEGVPESETQSDRQKELYTARLILEKIEARLTTDRFREYETDDAFLRYMRVYDQHLLTINTIRRDIELERLQEQIDELKQAQAERMQ